MERASRVMYTIANIVNWVLAALYAVLIVFSILIMAKVIDNNPDIESLGTASMLAWLIVALISSLVIICLVRIAKAKGTSKGWDILFIVLGAISSNVFYILGGIFGLVAPRK